MSTKAEAKNTGVDELKTEAMNSGDQINKADAAQPGAQRKAKPARKTEATDTAENFRMTLTKLDEERTALAKSAIEQLKPGRPFDPIAVRKINEIDRKKNRLLVSRFAFLLRRNNEDVQAIAYQLMQI
ncbi:hypothetical protein DF107_02595 [Burkholderia stagnalis]|uniref:hypothetical protein n=1 Tax=Burkholderia stagnalis TaxID=1503054 RepID=UPI000F5A1501|nr:hypothetical protein [Burkholderia stagnalis]RQQ21296.1 hypothetical protein DF161_00555 [Burkholderia stagnalis]RQY84947.1 hypothetical protein DF107_02595 [Burkholderia stagnalis]